MCRSWPPLQSEHNSEFSGLDELLAIDRSLANYNRHIVGLFAEFLGDSRNVVDFGAGIGTLSKIYRAKTGISPVCVEIDADAGNYLTGAGLETRRSIDDIAVAIDGLFTSNVLEHIADDAAALRAIHNKMKPGGKLAIYVPAFMLLFSDMDRKVGHYRRYSKSELVEKVRNAGFSINSVRYVDSVGFLASLPLVLMASWKTSGSPQMPVSASSMKFYDRYLFPLSRLLDRVGLRHLLGKNLYLQAVRD
ncbi:MAG: methyltransferase domain-containing protein [Woeseia sp.]